MTGLTDKFKNRNKKRSSSSENDEDVTPVEHYEEGGYSRNLCFVQPDGEKEFVNYAYLVSGKYTPNTSEIVLTYTICTVTLKGYKLEGLFDSLMNHVPKEIRCEDERYAVKDRFTVISIDTKML